MSSYAGPNSSRSEDVVPTLRLIAYLAAAIVLIALDHRGGWISQLRKQGDLVMQPVWWMAGLPGRLGDSARTTARTHTSLAEENRKLRNALLISGARNARLQAASDENQRIRDLLGAARRGRLDVQLVPIMDIDMDPSRQRLLLAGGSGDGVKVGQSVIDAGGLVGQIISVTPTSSTVLLLTDPAHAVPVEVARSGVRLVVYGNGRSDQLVLENIPLSSDVKVGDSIVTSGLGDRFPSGFLVGTISALHPDDSRAFLIGDVTPAAQLDRGRDVLLLRDSASPLLVGQDKLSAGMAAAGDADAPAVAFGSDVFHAARPTQDPSPQGDGNVQAGPAGSDAAGAAAPAREVPR